MPTWPAGKQFAFTIVDDTDYATVEKVRPVYEFLLGHGIRSTKTVWPLPRLARPITGGSTLDEPAYREWILNLQECGVEIAFHGATDGSSSRQRVIAALDRFREVLGCDPRLHANHTGQREGIYWGEARMDGLARLAYLAAAAVKGYDRRYGGHDASSEYFWGDVCRDRLTYVRNFAFRDVNTTSCDPLMPYHDARRPFVPYWFSCSEGPVVTSFCEMLTEVNQDRLADEGGACIMYTHFGAGFTRNGRLHPEFGRLMRRLAALPGWFVPASTLLDHLRAQPSWTPEGNPALLRRMQWRWLRSKLLHGPA